MNLAPTLPPYCTGGLVEYATLYLNDVDNWAKIAARCSLTHPHLILLIVILCAAISMGFLFISCVFPHRLYFCRCRRSTYQLVQTSPLRSSSPTVAVGTNDVMLGTAYNLLCQSRSERFFQRKFKNTLLLFNVKSPDPFVPIQQTTSTTLLREIRVDGDDSGESSGLIRPANPCLVGRPRKRMLPRRLKAFAPAVAMFLIIAAVSGCTLYACFAARTIELSASELPNHLGAVILSSKILANEIISASYELMNTEVKGDVDTRNSKSNLRPFIEEMKSIFVDEAMQLYAMAMDVSRPSKTWLRKRSIYYLKYLNTVLRRLSSLFAVAPFLSNENIITAREIYYSFSYELARLAPHPLLQMHQKDPTDWQSILILNETAFELCRQSTSYFPNCSFVESYFARIASHIEPWPRIEDKRDLSSVTGYMRAPQLLNAEEYVKKWLPVAQDPTGGIPFLFDELVVPEIDKERKKLNRSLNALHKKLTKGSVDEYISLAGKVPLVITGVLTMSMGIFVVVLVFNWSERSFFEPGPRRGLEMCTSIFLATLFVLAISLCVAGVLIGAIGALGHSQLCVYLIEKPEASDKWLHHLINSTLYRTTVMRNVLKIDDLNVELPRSIFKTINAHSPADNTPFLKATGMNRPANLSALLHSSWLNQTLYDLWYTRVWPQMVRNNLSSQVPRLPLTKVVTRFSSVVRLEKTFDDLYVGNVSEYLPDPTHNYYTQVGLALQVLSKRGSSDAHRYAAYFLAVGQLVDQYRVKYDHVKQALDVIGENKRILEPLLPIIAAGDKIMGYLAKKSNVQLVKQFTNNTAEIWLNSRNPIDRFLLPVVYKILDRLFPYKRLITTYRTALAPFCPTEYAVKPLFKTLRNYGFALSLSSLFLAVICVVRIQYPKSHLPCSSY